MILALTGHRPKYLGNEYYGRGPYSDYIRGELQKIIDIKKPIQMISGMALGCDTIWAQLALLNRIPLIAAIPFIGQEARWRNSNKVEYCRILEQAYEVTIVSESSIAAGSVGSTMKLRDVWMVDHCHELVAVLHKHKKNGGTYYTVNYAKKQKVPITYIDPEGWKP